MEISGMQPLFLLLLVTLLFIPAPVRSSANFNNCELPLVGRDVVHVDSLEISPDTYDSDLNPRTGNFTLTAHSTENIKPDEVSVYLEYTADFVTYNNKYPLCNVTACPVVPGPLTITFTDVFSEGPRSTKLPFEESFLIQIMENKTPFTVIMCISFSI